MQIDVEKTGHGHVVVSALHPGGQADRLLGAPEDEVEGPQAYTLVSFP